MNKTVLQKTIRRLSCSALVLLALAGMASARSDGEEKLSLSRRNVPLAQVLEDIKQQSRYVFANRDVDLKALVSIEVTEQPVREICRLLFSQVNADWKILGSTIVIMRLPEKKPAEVRGTVRDEAGQPVPGVSVFIKGTQIGTTTGLDGTFSLTVPVAHLHGTLEVNSLGYEVRTFPLGGSKALEITLKEETVALEGTVVTALGIRRDEKALSYNVQEVKSDLLTAVKDANFINSLAGKAAGVIINASSSGIGGAAKVVLRGNKSISQSSNALYVIDGVPMYNFGGGGGTEFDSQGETESVADINPEDIESMSVLTGAAAAALYGSQAANGAIMITTRKGHSGRVKVTFSGDTEFLTPFVLPEFQNRYGTGLHGETDGTGVFSWGARLPESARSGYTPDDFFVTSHIYTNVVTVSGGTDRNRTYFSAGAVNSDGIIPNNLYDRYNFTFRNTTYLLENRLRLDASASYIIQKDQNMTNQGVYANPLTSVYLFPRGEDFDIYRRFERYDEASKLMEQFWSDDLAGDLRMQNPYWIAYRNLRNNDKKRYMFSFTAGYDFLDWLHVTGRVRVDNANSLHTRKLYATTEATISEGGRNGHYTEARGNDTQTYADVILNMDKNLGKDFSFVANIGASINDIRTDELTFGGPIQENGLANIFNVFDLDDLKKRASRTGWHDQTQSVFASVELGWKKMLYLTLTGRNDWASQLAGSSSLEKGFFYPSAGLSWVPTSIRDMGPLNYLKLRGSVASVGMPFPRFLTIPTFEYDETNKIWKDKTHYPIGDLRPERTLTYELGLEMNLWKDLSLNVSWYLADTYNQTFDPMLPPSSSYSTMYLQTGNVRNTGVEASLGYDHSWGGFNWNSGFTFSWNRNRIRQLAEGAVNPLTGKELDISELKIKALGKAIYILRKGGSLGDLYTTSSLLTNDNGYIEIDNTGNVAVTDGEDEIFLGTVFPEYNLAWRNDFRLNGLHFGFLFACRIGGVCYSATQANMDLYGVSEASAAARDAGGVLVNGRQSVNPQKWYNAIGSQSGLPQYYTYDASNFRLQEASIGYTFPRKWFRNKCGLTLSAVGHNLWMIYCKAPFDPESIASTGNNYQGIDYFMMPSLRSTGFNVKLEF